MNKENCLIWQQAVDESEGKLTGNCPLQRVCTEGCMLSVQPLDRKRRFDEMKRRCTNYSDKKDHMERSKANHK